MVRQFDFKLSLCHAPFVVISALCSRLLSTTSILHHCPGTVSWAFCCCCWFAAGHRCGCSWKTYQVQETKGVQCNTTVFDTLLINFHGFDLSWLAMWEWSLTDLGPWYWQGFKPSALYHPRLHTAWIIFDSTQLVWVKKLSKRGRCCSCLATCWCTTTAIQWIRHAAVNYCCAA